MLKNKILFVFEGKRTEDIIVKSLERYILTEKRSPIIKCAFDAEIYQLYKKINDDEYLDTFALIKELNKDLLGNYTRNDFAEIYLFFDYDGHATLARSQNPSGNPEKPGDEQIQDLLLLFNNETENGKLYISYPMVEALRHIVDFKRFQEVQVKCKKDNCQYKNTCDDESICMEEAHYKTRVAKESIPQLANINGYNKEIWIDLINSHLSKMNYIVNNIYDYPQKTETQQDVFENQLNKFILKKCPEVSVLSAFPIFIHDYYGNKRTKELLSNNSSK